jgi:hypothetical protein
LGFQASQPALNEILGLAFSAVSGEAKFRAWLRRAFCLQRLYEISTTLLHDTCSHARASLAHRSFDVTTR